MQGLSHFERKKSVDGSILNLLIPKPISVPITPPNPRRLRHALETQKLICQRLHRELPTPPHLVRHHVADINEARDKEPVLGSAEHVLVHVVPNANEGVVRVAEEAAEGEWDAGRVVELEYEAQVANAKLESGGGVGRWGPLDAKADDEAAVVDVVAKPVQSLLQPFTDDGGGGSDGDVDAEVEEENHEGSNSLRIWGVLGFDGYFLVVHGGGFVEVFLFYAYS
jgi:hypothetical protein